MAAAVMLVGAIDAGAGNFFFGFAWGAAPSSYRVIAAAPGVSVRRVGISVGLLSEFLSLGAGAAGLTGARDGGRGDAGGCDRRSRRQFLFRVLLGGAAPSSYRVIAAAPGVSVRRVGISVGLLSEFLSLGAGAAGLVGVVMAAAVMLVGAIDAAPAISFSGFCLARRRATGSLRRHPAFRCGG